MPLACTADDLAAADLVVAVKEAEHRALLTARFEGWEDRVIYWHVHDIDVADPAVALPVIDGLVRELVTALR